MTRILLISLSILLALGLFADKYLPFMKEILIGVLIIVVVTGKQYNKHLINNLRKSSGLLLIFIIFLFLNIFMSYHIDGEPLVNYKFLLSIVFFVTISTLFSAYPQYVNTSLIFFGIGAGILSLLYFLGFFGSDVYTIRNERLILLGENPNSLSVRISLGVLFLVWAFIENDLKLNKFLRLLLVVPIPFMFNLILISGSKGSFILCILSVGLYVILLKNVSVIVKRISLTIAVLIGFLALIVFSESTLYTRFIDSDFTSGRTSIWGEALKIFSNNPFGVGEIGYKVEILKSLGRVIDSHNLFIYLLVCGGVLSLIIFLHFLYKLFIVNVNKYKVERNMIYLTIFFSMIFIMSKTGGVLYYLIMWYFLACISTKTNKAIKNR